MSEQQITPELREWIVAQAAAGQPPEAVLKAMLDSGWEEPVAVKAMEVALREYLADHAKAVAAIPEPTAVPRPSWPEGATTVFALDREVKLLTVMREPQVVVFGGLLSGEECDEIIAHAEARLTRSETVHLDTGSSEINPSRTSDGMFFNRGEHPVCAKVEARLAALLNWPMENGEGLQVLRYRPGAEYKPHYDYFDPAQPGTPLILKRGGQRVATIVMYLNDPARGGATTFPDLNLEVGPVKGNAVFFSYDRPHPSTRSLHGGAPMIEGEKWIATKWLRQGRFD